MLFSRFRPLRDGWKQLALQLSWNHLPPLTTHVLAFLLGTLFLRSAPGSVQAVPQQVLFPIEALLKKGSQSELVNPSRSYFLARKGSAKPCLRWDQPLRIWAAARNQRYLALPARKNAEPLLRALLAEEELVLIDSEKTLEPCGAVSKVGYD